ncbi:ComEC/Rec2 family competence protein [Flagellimonas algicola]|uniref:MBL fold metallo-hydrolase n=1 Tax=Flagellimonas algicola TaxID=2583815 RepID=A0ABY2WRW2_9FLAO|nr:MBL fold metallo-hydrolase [Allomuricauda algicola]TMU57485.1 MBL fold metallo-hydrolase [Allomuricauda algicola]
MGDLKIIFLSAGNGDSIFLEYTDDVGELHFGLVDCNDRGRFKPTQTFLKRYFELKDDGLQAKTGQKILERKGSYIFDYIFISHSHADHMGGLKDIIRNYGARRLFYFKNNKWGAQAPFVQAMKNGFTTHKWFRKIEHDLPLAAGTSPVLFESSEGSVECEVIWPFDGEISGKENNNSLIILIKHGHFNFLLGGDAEQSVWRDDRVKTKINQLEKVHILKVPHHGAKNGFLNTKGDFIAQELAAKTECAIVSSHIWRYGHPSEKVINQLDEHSTHVLRTEVNQNQNIQFISNGKTLEAQYFNKVHGQFIT